MNFRFADHLHRLNLKIFDLCICQTLKGNEYFIYLGEDLARAWIYWISYNEIESISYYTLCSIVNRFEEVL